MSNYYISSRDSVCRRQAKPSIEAANRNYEVLVSAGAPPTNNNYDSDHCVYNGKASCNKAMAMTTVAGAGHRLAAPVAPLKKNEEHNAQKISHKYRRKTHQYTNRLVVTIPLQFVYEVRAKIRDCGLTTGECIARALLGLSIPIQVNKTSFRAAMWHLSKIGNNLNQLAKGANQNGRTPNGEVLLYYGALVEQALQELKRL